MCGIRCYAYFITISYQGILAFLTSAGEELVLSWYFSHASSEPNEEWFNVVICFGVFV